MHGKTLEILWLFTKFTKVLLIKAFFYTETHCVVRVILHNKQYSVVTQMVTTYM